MREQPGQQVCLYYLRTGTCGYGDRCRYHHPDRGGAIASGSMPTETDYPERSGQPICEYYMKTGTCKYGSSCKYHHPRQGAVFARQVALNSYGYPLRMGEKECSYYMKTGSCKFGSTCKFHHPELMGIPVPSSAAGVYSAVQPSIPAPQPYPALAGWQLLRPSVLPGPYMQGSYPSMVVPPSVVPVQGWGHYVAPTTSLVSTGQQNVQPGPGYELSVDRSSAVGYASPYLPLSSSVGPSSNSEQQHMLPDRPGQPECQYYMRTGGCKYGATCKYHHPQDRVATESNYVLSPLGLPLRPGVQPCRYYAQNGFCKFGPTCKFDHPPRTLSNSPSASSLPDMPIALYPLGYSVPSLAPSLSAPELRPEYIYSNDSSRNQGSASEAPSGTVTTAASTEGFPPPHPLIDRQSPASSTVGATCR